VQLNHEFDIEASMKPQDIGLIGLAVMGQNLVLNMERNGFYVAVYNRTVPTTKAFIEGAAAGKNITAAYAIEDLIRLLKKPRVIMIMVKAGAPVDEVISQLKPYLEPGDLIMDGGNSHFADTERRSKEMEALGIHYLGVGVSGGEEGALRGPSIMPGGPREAYVIVEPLFKAIAAKVDEEPCVTWIGPRGAGHFVKMVHNAIEYGDMQLIAEAYDLLHRGLGLEGNELHEVFARWNQGPLCSYLIEITSDIFAYPDPETQKPLVEMILDQAEQKGTGRWTIQTALELGVPIPTIAAAVDARVISSYKNERVEAAGTFPFSVAPYTGDRDIFIQAVGDALYVAKICSYAQGMALLRKACEVYDYLLDFNEIARIWRGGCIIRARFLNDVRSAFQENRGLVNLLLAPFFREAVTSRHTALRQIVKVSAETGIPTPGMGASLAYFDSYRSSRLPANLTQAQRDYFGAHTYRRIDREGICHTKWTE
jgi:6-phosphogluconate dehydrogenase